MPYSVNGIGTSVSGSRGDIGWGSHDAMECFVIFMMPIIPYKAMHTFDWQGDQYRQVPIRWSWELVLRTFALPWSWGVICLGGLFLVFSIFEINAGRPKAPLFLAIGLPLVGLGILALVLLRVTDLRNKAIRRVIGGLTVGTCDPVTMTDKLLADMKPDPKPMYGTDTFADAVEPQLKKGAYGQAMWAARMAVRLEDRREGERLTNMLLSDPDVQAAIDLVKQKPDNWVRAMLPPDEAAAVEEAQRLDVSAGAPRPKPKPGPDARSYDDEDEEPKANIKRKRNDDY